MTRYAIYAMPATDSELWDLGSSILGYDAVTGRDVPFPDHPIFHDPLSLAWSAEPRRYGFHATLKAPFHLAEGCDAADLQTDLAAFSKGRKPFTLDLTLAVVGHFLALVSIAPDPAIEALAADCVRHFDPYRAPLTPEDRERRHPETLIQRQVENLDTWGYPYVFDDFQFHMTLTGAMEPADRHRLEPVLRDLLAKVPLRFTIDALSLFVQPDREGRFLVVERFPFGG